MKTNIKKMVLAFGLSIFGIFSSSNLMGATLNYSACGLSGKWTMNATELSNTTFSINTNNNKVTPFYNGTKTFNECIYDCSCSYDCSTQYQQYHCSGNTCVITKPQTYSAIKVAVNTTILNKYQSIINLSCW